MGFRASIEDVLPFAAMVAVECVEVGMLTLSKAAMNKGMSNLVYVVYHNALGTFLLLPYFIIHCCRSSNRTPLTFSLLARCFTLGLLGICLLQVCAYTGVQYSSPTLASALGNLIPGFTFLLAITFGVEKLELRRSSSQAKALGTLVVITGAFVMTLYKGPAIGLNVSPDSPHQILLSEQSNWMLGGLLIAMACLFASIWNVFQAATVREYPDETTVVFLFFCFGTIQCAVLSVLIVRDPSAWVLQPGIEMIAVMFSGILGGVFRINAVTWCLRKKGPVFVALFHPIQMIMAVMAGIIVLGDTLRLGSVIGGSTIAVGFYTVTWGLAKEKEMVVDIVSGLVPSTQHTPLLHKTNV